MALNTAVRIIDADGHIMEDLAAINEFMPSPFKDYAPSRFTQLFPPLDHLHSARLSSVPPGSFSRVGPEGWSDFLDDIGIETTVLYPTGALSYGKIVSTEWAIAATRAYNDWLYETYLRRSPRFKGMGLIPLQEPEAAVEELRRIVQDLGMCGAFLPSTGLKAHLGSKEYWPVYQEADRLGCCLSVHGGCHSGLGFDDMNVYTAVNALGHPFGLLISFSAIVFNGIFDKFPNVKFAFLEGGVAWFLMAFERLDGAHASHVQYDPLAQYGPKANERAGDYILKHIKAGRIFVGCEGDEPTLPYAVKMFGSGPFMYSSDFPHEVTNESCREEIQKLLASEELAQADKEAVLYRNAERFYAL